VVAAFICVNDVITETHVDDRIKQGRYMNYYSVYHPDAIADGTDSTDKAAAANNGRPNGLPGRGPHAAGAVVSGRVWCDFQ
jgi:hypothetical protein